MHIDIVIPTKNRLHKLLNCIKSIPKDEDVTTYIYFDNEKELNDFSQIENGMDCKLRIVKEYKASTFWNSHLKQCTSDVMIYVNDDVLFPPNLINQVKTVFSTIFKDREGVLGFNQYNINSTSKLDCAFGAIGIKYADNFIERKVFCSDYHRFYLDREMGDYAKSIGKFHYDPNIKICHLHPCTNPLLIDETHKDVRKYLKQDQLTYQKRQQKSLLWGRDFQLINS